jgi:hypothetical protein
MAEPVLDNLPPDDSSLNSWGGLLGDGLILLLRARRLAADIDICLMLV